MYFEENLEQESELDKNIQKKKVENNDEVENAKLKDKHKNQIIIKDSARVKIIKKYSFSKKLYIFKKMHKKPENFRNENEFYDLYRKSLSKYKYFVQNEDGIVKIDNSKRNEQKLVCRTNYLKFNACKTSIEELLDFLKQIKFEDFFVEILQIFEMIKKEIALGSKRDQTKVFKIFENEIFLPFQEAMNSLKKKLAFCFLTTFEKVLKYLNILHSEKFCHLDLKPGNILFNSFKDIVLIDFEGARNAINISKESNIINTRKYKDPEISNENKFIKDGRRCDSFSFSVIIQEILDLLQTTSNFNDKDNCAIIFLEKLKTLLEIKRTPVNKVLKFIKAFKFDHINDFKPSSFDFYFNFLLGKFCFNNAFNKETFINDYQRIMMKENGNFDHVNFFNENAYLSFMSINNDQIYSRFFNHVLDIKCSLIEYPIFYCYVYSQKNINYPKLLQILGQFYFSLNRYSNASCLLRGSVKIYAKEMKKFKMTKHDLYFEACIMLANAYLLNENLAEFEQLKLKIEDYLKNNDCDDYRFTLVLAHEQGMKGNVEKRKELLIKSLRQLKQKDPKNRSIVSILDLILENQNREELDEDLRTIDQEFNDPLSLSIIFKRKMLAAYIKENEQETEEYFEKLKGIYFQLGLRSNHPFIYYLNYMRCSMILRFNQKNRNIQNVFQENDEKFSLDQDYRLEDKGREYNIRIKSSSDMQNEEIASLREKTDAFLKPMKNYIIKGYTYLNMAALYKRNGDIEESKGNIEKSRELWKESVENFNKSRHYYCKRHGENHDHTIWTDTLKAEVLFKLNLVNEALTTIAKPYQEYPKIYGLLHGRTKKTIEVYEKILKKIENE